MNRIVRIGMACAVFMCMTYVASAQNAAPPVLEQAVAEARAEPAQPPRDKPKPHVEIDRIEAVGMIEGENLTLSLAFDADAQRNQQEIPLVTGAMVLDTLTQPTLGYKLRYDKPARTYHMGWPRKGKYRVEATFAARAQVLGKSEWREASFTLPASQVRQLEVRCDRTDLQVKFPGAMRVDREERNGQLVITAILGPGKPFTVRWKPQVQQLDAKLVATGKANTVATVSAAALRIDSIFQIDIAQGELDKITFELPTSLGITQVVGSDIRDWSFADADDKRTLTVTLVRPQTQQYALQVIAEQPLPPFPCQLPLPVISPSGGIRAGGNLVVGTGSAIQLQVAQTSGLSQVDAKMFPRVLMSREHPRPLPTSKAFYYAFAASPYRLALKLDDILPSYDASHLVEVTVKEDDLLIDAGVTLDVRDAPIRSIRLNTSSRYLVSSVTGSLIDDYRVTQGDKDQPTVVEVRFSKPVIGKTNLQMRLELGRGPLGELQAIRGVDVVGAKMQRGDLVVAAEPGIRVGSPTVRNLREINTANAKSSLPNAQLAYRFREADWSLQLTANRKPAGIRTESFHLLCLGEGRMYGSVAVSYFITGSPIDELQFRLPAALKNVQFVGRDVRRSTQNGDLWTVKLQRKIIGDYNLGITYNLPYEDGGKVVVGAVECAGVQTTVGYIAITSHLNLKLSALGEAADRTKELMEITREELPGGYRLLATAPLLKTFKYVDSSHSRTLQVDLHTRGDVIPALIEVMQAETKLALRENNKTESVTTIRYKVKNTSSQFLTLQLPKGAKVWSTRLIERLENNTEKTTRLNTSFDARRGLMIPLRRPRDPNQPITIELEYGQVHEGLSWWESQVLLLAPRSEIPATFAEWRVHVSEDFAIRPGGGNMVAQVSTSRPGDLSWVLEHVIQAWVWSAGTLVDDPSKGAVLLLAALAALVAVLGILFAILYRPALPILFGMALLLMILGMGVAATRAPAFQSQLPNVDHMTDVRFTQAVNVDESDALSVGIQAIPAWRRHVPLSTVVAGPVLLLVALGLAVRSRLLRKPMIAAVLAVLLYGSAQFAVMTVPLGHGLTWGLSALLLIAFIWMRLLRPLLMHHSIPVGVAASVLLIGAVTLMPGCGGGPSPRIPISDQPLIERIDCQLTASEDSMELDYTLKISAAKPMKFALIDQSAVLLSDDKPTANVEFDLDDGKYYVTVKKQGVYTVTAKFLAPLAEADANRVRGFSLPMPMALSNRVNLKVPEPDLNITAPTAMRFEQDHQAAATTALALLGPGEPIHFTWRPRARQTRLEETRFYGYVTSVTRFDAGVVEAHHQLRLQIAQGELKRLRVAIPHSTTVTSVQGRAIGAWRFDPAAGELDVRFSQPVTNAYPLAVVTQAAVTGAPYQFTVRPLVIDQALRQWNIVGLVSSPAVYLTASSQAQPINVDDFARDAAAMLQQVMKKVSPPRKAYRLAKAEENIAVDVAAVQPELRIGESATFNVFDERLVYNGQLNVTIAKAGLFALNLTIPAEYDIDTLTARQISHWDEQVEGDRRRITVHFKQKAMGAVPINLALSQPIAQIPDRLEAPRVQVEEALKHAGQLIVRSVRGVRLGVAGKQGVSEINPVTLNIREQGVLAFKLLRPDWALQLQTEVLEPLISNDFLHVARVSEGMVRHEHYLYYRLRHAGVKVLNVRIPAEAQDNAAGLTITGPKIARRRQVEPGLWSIELAEKQFDRPYLLRIDYQSRFDRNQGQVPIEAVVPVDADQTRGHVVLFTSDRIELKEQTVGPALQPAEARNISQQFGAGDLSEAAYCVTTSSTAYKLVMSARRHDAADLLEADVRSANITSVITETGQGIHRVQMEMMVGSKRHLRMQLPEDAALWSLLVNGRAAIPSHLVEGERVIWLIPLAQAAAGDLPVSIDLVYVGAERFDHWLGRRRFLGPRFDLPLKNIRWTFHLPEGYAYDDFEGTLTHTDEEQRKPVVLEYGLQQYEQTIQQEQRTFNKKAAEFQRKAKQVAQQGGKFGQYQAREMLEQARSWSYNDRALNEDINVDLDNLLRQQAKVGLVGNRARLRRQTPEAQPNPNAQQQVADSLGDQFSVEQAERVESSLSAADNENLDLITRRMIQVQQAAAGRRIQLMVQMPQRGRVLRFTRPLQVESEMLVSFEAAEQLTRRLPRGTVYAAGLFLVFAVGLWLSGLADRGLDRAADSLARTHRRTRKGYDDPYITADVSDTEPISASELNLPADTPGAPEATAEEDEDTDQSSPGEK